MPWDIILRLALEAAKALPALIAAGHDVGAILSTTRAVIDADHPPGPEWETLESLIAPYQQAVRDTSGDV